MAIVSTTKMTSRQYLQLGEDPPGVRLELVDGQIAVHPGQTIGHSHVEMALLAAIGDPTLLKNAQLFLNIDIVLGEYDVRRPDLVYFCAERAHLIPRNEAISDPPDLCVEVISETSGELDRQDKFEQYAKAGVAYYWIVDPEARTIEAFRLNCGVFVPAANGSSGDNVRLPPFEHTEFAVDSLWFRRRSNAARTSR